MSVNFEPDFETPRFDPRLLSCSGTTASRLDEEFFDSWKQEDADVTFVGPDGLMFAIETKFDPTRKSDAIMLWSALHKKIWSDPTRFWVYVGANQNLLKQSAILLSFSSISESVRDLESHEILASAYSNVWRSLAATKPEAIHPITKTAYAKLSELPAAQITRDAIGAILHQFMEALAVSGTVTRPPLKLVPLEESCYLLEWTFKDRRLGFSFETDPKDSGWYYVYSNNSSERYESGTMDQLEMNRLIAMTLKP